MSYEDNAYNFYDIFSFVISNCVNYSQTGFGWTETLFTLKYFSLGSNLDSNLL